ncbi:MAG: hypothetical protein AB8G05_27490 [Oligoflexales bacterium]
MAKTPYQPKEKNEDELRYLKSRADKIELEVALKKGELVTIKEVETEWNKMTLAFRNKMLGIPGALAPVLADIDDITEVEYTLKKAVMDALTEIVNENTKK